MGPRNIGKSDHRHYSRHGARHGGRPGGWGADSVQFVGNRYSRRDPHWQGRNPYVSEGVPPGVYVVRVEGRDMLAVDSTVTVALGTAVTADFKLEWINPGPVHLESTFSGDLPDSLPINGRNFLNAGQLDPGVQVVDGRVLDQGKSGFQSLSINSQLGRTTHYDMDEVEVMDETKGASTLTLPSEAVREVIVSRATPELFQSLNAAGAVRIATRSGGDEWHGNLFGNFRDRPVGMAGFPSGSPNYSRQQYGFGAGGAVIKDKAFLFLSGERSKQDGVLPIQLGFPALQRHGPAERLFSREHAHGAVRSQLQRKHEGIRAAEL